MSEITRNAARPTFLEPSDTFPRRHIGPRDDQQLEMLKTLGFDSLDGLTDNVIPRGIRYEQTLELDPPLSESELLTELKRIADRNEVWRSYLGTGYSDCITPPVILRNVLENPGWYTQYTPYQAEIAQGRLEALLNFQTVISELTGLPLANASLLDEATAAAEAMAMCRALVRPARSAFFVSSDCHPQTIEVVKARAEPLGIEVRIGDASTIDHTAGDLFGVLLQYPASDGSIGDPRPIIDAAHAAGAMAVVACDLLALTMLRSPAELGADIAVGCAQRFGVPLGFGGPHAGFLSSTDAGKRQMPGRIVGVSRDDAGEPAYRLALQTREQHIRRDKATSNICTAQVLLAIISAMYAVYHGPQGLLQIARRVHGLAATLAEGLRAGGCELGSAPFFDTLRVQRVPGGADAAIARAAARKINLRRLDDETLVIALDETTGAADVAELIEAVTGRPSEQSIDELASAAEVELPEALRRNGAFLQQEVFNSNHSEHEMLRYLHAPAEPRALAGALDDPAGLLHDEAQRNGGDDPGHLARLRQDPSLRADLPDRGLHRADRATRGLAGRDHRLPRRLAAAQRRRAGRVRRTARDPRLAPGPWRRRSQRLPDPDLGPRHQPGQRGDGRDAGRAGCL